jgi:hypothetical protein
MIQLIQWSVSGIFTTECEIILTLSRTACTPSKYWSSIHTARLILNRRNDVFLHYRYIYMRSFVSISVVVTALKETMEFDLLLLSSK